MNMEEFAAVLNDPPAGMLNEFAFLADVPAGRSLEGYIRPETYEFAIAAKTATPRHGRATAPAALEEALTDEILGGMREPGADPRPGGDHREHRRAGSGHRRGTTADRGGLHQSVPDPDNRITNGLLNADPTLQYGLATGDRRPEGHPMLRGTGAAAWRWTSGAPSSGGRSSRPAATRSPRRYAPRVQTYAQTGLPPMPIAAPRSGSIEAVARRRSRRASCSSSPAPDGVRDGSHCFAASLTERQANVARANEECAGNDAESAPGPTRVERLRACSTSASSTGCSSAAARTSATSAACA